MLDQAPYASNQLRAEALGPTHQHAPGSVAGTSLHQNISASPTCRAACTAGELQIPSLEAIKHVAELHCGSCSCNMWQRTSQGHLDIRNMHDLQERLQSNIDLEGIVDGPLGGCQGSNHDNAQAQASGGQLPPTHVTHYAANGGFLKHQLQGKSVKLLKNWRKSIGLSKD